MQQPRRAGVKQLSSTRWTQKEKRCRQLRNPNASRPDLPASKVAVSASTGTEQRCLVLHQLLNESAGYVHWYPRIGMRERTCVQHWLRSVQSRHVGAFEELPDGNPLTPKQRLAHRGHPVR